MIIAANTGRRMQTSASFCMPNRGAPRLRRGAAERGGIGDGGRGPHLSQSLGGSFEAPHDTRSRGSRSDRHGLAAREVAGPEDDGLLGLEAVGDLDALAVAPAGLHAALD